MPDGLARRYDPLISFDDLISGLHSYQPELNDREKETVISDYLSKWDERRAAAVAERQRVGQGVAIDPVLEQVEQEAQGFKHPDLPEKVVLWNQLRERAAVVVPGVEQHAPQMQRDPVTKELVMPGGEGQAYGAPEMGKAFKQAFGRGTVGRAFGMEPWRELGPQPYAGPSPLHPNEWQWRDPYTERFQVPRPPAKYGRAYEMLAGAAGGLAAEPQLAAAAVKPWTILPSFALMKASQRRSQQLEEDYQRQQAGEEPRGFGAAEAVEVAKSAATGLGEAALLGPAGRFVGAPFRSAIGRAVAAVPAEAGVLTAGEITERALIGDPALTTDEMKESFGQNAAFMALLKAGHAGIRGAGPAAARGAAAVRRAAGLRETFRRAGEAPPGPRQPEAPGFDGIVEEGPIPSAQGVGRPGATVEPGRPLLPDLQEGFVSSRQPGAPRAAIAAPEARPAITQQPWEMPPPAAPPAEPTAPTTGMMAERAAAALRRAQRGEPPGPPPPPAPPGPPRMLEQRPWEMPPPEVGYQPPLEPMAPVPTGAERATQALRRAARGRIPGAAPPVAEPPVSIAPAPVPEAGIPPPVTRPPPPPRPEAPAEVARPGAAAKPPAKALRPRKPAERPAPKWRDEELRQEIETVQQRISTGRNLKGEPLPVPALQSDITFRRELKARLSALEAQQRASGQRIPAVAAVRGRPPKQPPAAPTEPAPAPTPREAPKAPEIRAPVAPVAEKPPVSEAPRGELATVPRESPLRQATSSTRRLFMEGVPRVGTPAGTVEDAELYIRNEVVPAKQVERLIKEGIWDPQAAVLTEKGKALFEEGVRVRAAKGVELAPDVVKPAKPKDRYTDSDLDFGKRGVKAVQRFASTDETRTNLAGFNVGPSYIEASDGHTLIRIPGKPKQAPGIWNPKTQQKIEGEFPDTNQVIPKETAMTRVAELSVPELEALARPGATWQPQARQPARVVIKEGVEINSNYALRVAQAFDDLGVKRLEILTTAEQGPIMFREAGVYEEPVTALVMPIRPPEKGEVYGTVTRLSALKEVPARKRRPGEAGVAFLARKRPKIDTSVDDKDVAAVLEVVEGPPFPQERWHNRLKETLGGWLENRYDLRNDPQLREKMRQAHDEPRRINARTAAKMRRIMGPLMDPARKDELELARQIIVLRGHIEATDLPGGYALEIPRERFEHILEQRLERATPEVRDTVNMWRETFYEEAEIDVKRGMLPEHVLKKKFYYPHYVMDFYNYLGEQIRSGTPQALKEPYKAFTQRRMGTWRRFDPDVWKIGWKHLNSVHLARFIDDFAVKWLTRRDITSILTAKEKADIGQLWDGRVMRIRGHLFTAYQYRPWGNQYYVVTSPLEQVALDVTTPLKVGAERFYIVPKAVADNFKTWRYGAEHSEWRDAFFTYHSWWKRLLLDSIGLPYEIRNLIGDNMHFVAEEGLIKLAQMTPLFGTGREIAQYLAVFRHPQLLSNPKYRQFFSRVDPYFLEEILKKKGVAGTAGWAGAEIPRVEEYRLRAITGQLGKVPKLKTRGLTLLDWLEYLRGYREDWARVGKAIFDARRIMSGEQVKSKVISTRGLSREDALARVARGFPTDYQDVAPVVGSARKWLFPWLPWFAWQAKYWPTYAWKNKPEFLAKFGVLMGLAFYWNTVIQKEQEQKLPLWKRLIPLRLNTGYYYEDGTPIAPALPGGFEVVARFMGLDKMMVATQEYAWGEITPSEWAEKVFPAPLLGIPGFLEEAMGPVVGALYGIVTNKKPFTKRPVVSPPDMRGDYGNLETWKQRGYFVLEQLAPWLTMYEQAMRRASREPGYRPPGSIGHFVDVLVSGPLNWKRALTLQTTDPQRNIQQLNYEHLNRLNSYFKRAREAVKKAYIKREVEGDLGGYNRIRAFAYQGKFGVPISSNDIKRWESSPYTQRDLVDARLRKESDPEKQKKLHKDAEYWASVIGREREGDFPLSVRDKARLEQLEREITRPPIRGRSLR